MVPAARLKRISKKKISKKSKRTPGTLAKPAARKSAQPDSPANKRKASLRTRKKAPLQPAIRIRLKLPEPAALPWRECLPGETLVGVVEDFLGNQNVMITTPHHPIKLGDHLHVRGCTTDFIFPLESIQLDYVPVVSVPAGQPVGIRVSSKVRKNDHLYLIRSNK